MAILSDSEIKKLALKQGMISPFEAGQIRKLEDGKKIISYGLSSYGYDARVSKECGREAGSAAELLLIAHQEGKRAREALHDVLRLGAARCHRAREAVHDAPLQFGGGEGGIGAGDGAAAI